MAIAFDGANFLVAWNDEVGGPGSGEWDVFGQLVNPGGDLVGQVIPITTEPGSQMVTSIAFDGVSFLAVWVDMRNSTNWDACGQYIDRNGGVLGAKTIISAEPGNQMVLAATVGSGAFVGVAYGVMMGEGGLSQVDYAVGALLAPPMQPRLVLDDGFLGLRSDRFGFNMAGAAGQSVVVESCQDLGKAIWQPIYTNTFTGGPLYFSDTAGTIPPARFYRLRSP
jgi:hypothetical protein